MGGTIMIWRPDDNKEWVKIGDCGEYDITAEEFLKKTETTLKIEFNEYNFYFDDIWGRPWSIMVLF